MIDYVYAICISASIAGCLYSFGQGVAERIAIFKALAWMLWAVAFSLLAIISGNDTRVDHTTLIITARTCLYIGGLILITYYCVRGAYLVRALYWRHKQHT